MGILKILRFLFLKSSRYLVAAKLKINIILSQLRLSWCNVEFQKGTYGKGFKISNKGKIILGEKVFLNSFPNGAVDRTVLNTYLPGSVIKIGNNSRLNGTMIHCNEYISIGENCMFGPGTVIVDNDSHRVSIDYFERIKTPISKPIKIGNNVWIGMNCTILKGVTIGENSIIAASSLVTKDIPKNCLFGGHPANFIKWLD